MMASVDDEMEEEHASSSVTGPDEAANSNGARNSMTKRYRGSRGSKTSDSGICCF